MGLAEKLSVTATFKVLLLLRFRSLSIAANSFCVNCCKKWLIAELLLSYTAIHSYLSLKP